MVLDWANKDAYFATPDRSETPEFVAPLSSSAKAADERQRWTALILGLALVGGGLRMMGGERERVLGSRQEGRVPPP
jgi:hypothetical protein